MRKIFFLFALVCFLTAGAQPKPTDWTHVAVITGNDINIRQNPSATSAPLGYLSSGEYWEDSCDFQPESIFQPAKTPKGMKFERLKLYKGEKVPVIGEDGEWLKIIYNGKVAYIMKKFASLEPVGTMTPRMNFGDDYYWDNNAIGILEDGRAIHFEQEMECWVRFGHLQDGRLIFDRCFEGEFVYEPGRQDILVEGDNYHTIHVGKKFYSGQEYSPVSVHNISAEDFDTLYKYSTPYDEGDEMLIVRTAEGDLLYIH